MNAGAAYVADPARPTAPTSCIVHGAGTPPVAGGDDAAGAVVNDQTGPVDAPETLCATICQKYRVPDVNPATPYDAPVTLAAACGGGLTVPNRTS